MSLHEYFTLFRELQTNASVPIAVTSLEPLDTSSGGGGGTSLTIADCEEILTDVHLGDSISVNGKRQTQNMTRRFIHNNITP